MNTQYFLIGLSLVIRIIAIGSADLIAEEAYYWNYANHLDFSYLDHPPMVAILIKLSTLVFGIHEFGVRFMSIICWFVCVWFSFQLTKCIAPKAGSRSIFLLSVLPFFFLHSLIITPDLPLMAAWSACLYYLYLALVKEDRNAWYWVGLWLGLGMLSKYTIVLLGPSALLYLILSRQTRVLLTPQPYLAILIALLLFSPVIYWNATHEWVSFLFQSTRRFNALDQGSLIAFFGLLVFFLTPVGLVSLSPLLFTSLNNRFLFLPTSSLTSSQKHFIQCFTFIPLLFFAVFSLTHLIKFNWIGPALLASIPWLGPIDAPRIQRAWVLMATCLLIGYSALIFSLVSGQPPLVYKAFLSKYIDWQDFSQQVHQIAEVAEKNWHKPVVLLPIDRYNLASELTFYQTKNHPDQKGAIFPVLGIDLFGYESLMYRYWSEKKDISNQILLLIAEQPSIFDRPNIQEKIVPLSPVKTFWTHNQGSHSCVNRYYYKFVYLKQDLRKK